MLENENINKPQNPAFLVGSVSSRFCLECEKPNILCKGMCQACYSKMHRNTKKGKEQMKAYNLSAGKEAQRKYRERKKALKPPKPPKPNCECGKKSDAKGYCITCYHKHYQRKKNGFKDGADRKNKPNSSLIFNRVLDEVKKGFTIKRACKNVNVQTSKLYRIISAIQKSELNAYKSIGFVNLLNN